MASVGLARTGNAWNPEFSLTKTTKIKEKKGRVVLECDRLSTPKSCFLQFAVLLSGFLVVQSIASLKKCRPLSFGSSLF